MTKNDPSGPSYPVWYASADAGETRSPLNQDISTDVCIVGAGIAGLATAYQLTHEGLDVVVLDDGPIGGGETGRTTAHLSCAIDDRFHRIESLHGETASRLAYESHASAIDWYEDAAAREDIQCDLERLDGYLFLPPHEKPEVLEREFAAARRAGVRGVRWLARAPLPLFDSGPCICFPRQGQIDPIKFIHSLAGAIERRKGRIFCRSHVTRIDDKTGITVECESGDKVKAKRLIIATNAPINTMVAMHTKEHAYRTYAIALPVPPRTVPLALFWDTSQEAGNENGPYHYVRLQRRLHDERDASIEQELLIVGGEDHKTGQADDPNRRWKRLEQWANERFPIFGPVKYRWSGQVMEPVDGLAFIGRSPGAENTFMVAGDSGMGMTHAAIAAMLLADLLAGRENEWEKLYDPSRKSLRSAVDYARENMNVAAQYMDWLRPGDVHTADAIPPGSGAVVRHGLKLLACYRDPAGVLHECSAACPHLGGVVQWNSAEHTWDCPCHGSRFDSYGHVLNGPTVSPLAPSHELKDTTVRSR